jgi:alanyl aminopeptidase
VNSRAIIGPVRLLLLAGATLSLLPGGEPSFYLPDGVRPVRYRLDLDIDPARPTFRGKVTIEVEAAAPARTVWLNGTGLTIRRGTIDGAAVRVQAVKHQFLALRPGATLKPGRHLVFLDYTGSIMDRPVGLSRRRIDGRWYAYTTFTAIEARRAIPCFDEPRFKTPWDIGITVPTAMLAVSNTREVSDTLRPGGWRAFRFAATLPLPSELVSFTVGPLEIVDGETAGKNHVPSRILVPRGHAAEARTAADATPEIIARLEAYTGIPYPWDKLDQSGIHEGGYGAVENPGLVQYRQGLLLSRSSSDTPEHRRLMRGIMAHELAHQWFGNLVTQRTWDDVWLSEGFATWLGMKISDMDLPSDRRGVARVIAARRMMASDREPRTRPVRKPMATVEEMRDVYSGVVYEKGAAVLAMLEQWLGEEPFQRALRRYLRQHSLGTATTEDLARAVQLETGVDVRPVFRTFLDGTGVPVVNAADGCPLNLTAPRDAAVPVCFLDGGKRECAIAPSSVQGAACPPSWFFGYAAGAGYYRLNPPFRGTVPERVLTPAERMAFILDRLAQVPLP